MPIRPLDVRRILNDQGASEARPLPAEHVASPTSPSTSAKSGSSGRTSFQSHGRTVSLAAESMNPGAATPSRSNRFSMTFPIQPATREQSPNRPANISPTKDTVAPEAVASPTGPTDSNFLTAIAAQERRVLELKEELQRAEKDLDKLKRQWANHEAHKKKNDAKRVTKLQPLNTTMPVPETQEDEDGSSAWMQMEMERRKALLNGEKRSSRTVFSGSRHTRALSLLSPVQKTGPSTFPSHPPRQDSLPRASLESEKQARPSYLSRASTTPDITAEVARTVDAHIDLTQANVDREALIKTGKKMATDFKDGLWTFWEDLRQATVGDEATQVMPPQMQRQNSSQTIPSNSRRDNSRSASLRPSSRGSTASKGSTETRRPNTRSPVNRRQSPAKEPPLVDVGGTFWNEANLPVPHEANAPVKKAASKHHKAPSLAPSTASSAGGEAWDTWDEHSPQDSRSSSATSEGTANNAENLTTPSAQNQRQHSPSSGGKKDPIPWPALSKLSPAASQLKRTASHLMNEWEKSMTPSPGQEYRGEDEGYPGFSAEAAALTPKKE